MRHVGLLGLVSVTLLLSHEKLLTVLTYERLLLLYLLKGDLSNPMG